MRAIRQHVNPLSRSYQQPVELPEGWVRAAFTNPGRPFHIDIGSARGRFCVDMALAHADTNFLGLEIRRPCVEEAFKKREKAGAAASGNCHFLACNANVDLERVVADVHREGAQVVRGEWGASVGVCWGGCGPCVCLRSTPDDLRTPKKNE